MTTPEQKLTDAETEMQDAWDYYQEMCHLWNCATEMKDKAGKAWDAAQSEVSAAWNAPHEATDDR